MTTDLAPSWNDELAAVKKENDTLRGLLGNSAKPCPYCGLASEDQGLCQYGFPGCMRADDQQLGKYFSDGYRADEYEKENIILRAELDHQKNGWSDCLQLLNQRYAPIEQELDKLSQVLRSIGEELVLAGFPGGDRTVIIANIRTLITERKDGPLV